VSNELVHAIDILPTLAAAVRADIVPRDRAIDGVNQLPFLEGKQAKSNRTSVILQANLLRKMMIDVDAVGISRSWRDFQTPVGAFSASTGVAASTSSSTSRQCSSRDHSRNDAQVRVGGIPESRLPREQRS